MSENSTFLNNRFPGNPPVMNDGRLFTDYRSHHDIQQELINNHFPNGNPDYEQYRQYLNDHANELKDSAYLKSWYNTRCRNCNSQQQHNASNEGTTMRNTQTDIINIIAKPKNIMN